MLEAYSRDEAHRRNICRKQHLFVMNIVIATRTRTEETNDKYINENVLQLCSARLSSFRNAAHPILLYRDSELSITLYGMY